MADKLPAPCANGKCSHDCPHFHWDQMPGWPSAEACYVWNESKDGKEPYYLSDSPCMPAFRLGRAPVTVPTRSTTTMKLLNIVIARGIDESSPHIEARLGLGGGVIALVNPEILGSMKALHGLNTAEVLAQVAAAIDHAPSGLSTGHKDQDGQEIFEGHVLEFFIETGSGGHGELVYSPWMKGVVVWKDAALMIDRHPVEGQRGLYPFYNNRIGARIIGHRETHPELICQ